MLHLLLFVHVFLVALVVGVFWGTWFSLSPSMSAITVSRFLEVGHTMIGHLGGPTAVLMPAALVPAMSVLVALYRGGHHGLFADARWRRIASRRPGLRSREDVTTRV